MKGRFALLILLFVLQGLAAAETGSAFYCFEAGEELKAVPLVRQGFDSEGYTLLPEAGGGQKFVLFHSRIGKTGAAEILVPPVPPGPYTIYVESYYRSSKPSVAGVSWKLYVEGLEEPASQNPETGAKTQTRIFVGPVRAWQSIAERFFVPAGAQLVLMPDIPADRPADFALHLNAVFLSPTDSRWNPWDRLRYGKKTESIRISLSLQHGLTISAPQGLAENRSTFPLLELPDNISAYGSPRFSFFIRKLPEGEWHPLVARDSGEEILRARAVELEPKDWIPERGLYELKMELFDPGVPSAFSFLERKTIAAVSEPARPFSVSIFTDRNRAVFAEGELLEFTVALRHRGSIPKGKLSIELWADDSLLSPYEEEIPEGSTRKTCLFRLRTEDLKPGSYSLRADFLGSRSEFRFDLAARDKKTTMKILLSAVTAGLSDNPANYVAASGGPASFADDYRKLHINRVYDQHLFYRVYTSVAGDLEAALRQSPELGAEELAVVPDRYFEELLRAGVEFGVFPIWALNQRGNTLIYTAVNEAVQEEMLRTLSWYTQALFRNPNFIGFNFFSDLGVLKRYWTNPEEEWKENLGRMMSRFKAETGVDAPQAPQVERVEEAVARNQPIDPALAGRYLGFSKFGAVLLDRGYSAFEQATKRLAPAIENTTSNGPTGRLDIDSLDIPFDPGPVFGSLDIATTWYFNEWHGIFPSAGAFLTDLLKARLQNKPVYAVANFFQGQNGPGRMRAEFFELLSRGPSGIGVNPTWFLFTDTPREGKIGRDELAPFFELVEQYGDFLMSLVPKKEVAILYCPDEDVLAGHHLDKEIEIYDALLRNHYHPAPIFLENITNGDLREFRALIIAGHKNLSGSFSAPALRAVSDFIARGGAVLLDPETSLSIFGAKRLDLATGLYRTSTMPDFELRKRAPAAGEAFRRSLGEPDSSLVLSAPDDVILVEASVRSRSDGSRYLWIINDRIPPFGAPPMRLEPQIAELELKDSLAGGTIYDLFSETERAVETRGGRHFLKIDLTEIEARLLAFYPERIDRLSIRLEGSPAPGKEIFYSLKMIGESGKEFGFPFPAEVRILDPQGVERFKGFPCIEEKSRRSFRLCRNDAPGEWTLEARESISGKSARLKFQVRPGSPPKESLIEQIDGPLLVKPETIGKFFHGVEKLLVVSDLETLAPEIDRFVEAARRAGIRCERKKSSEVSKAPRNNQNDPFPHYTIEEPLLLVGWPENNSLIKELSDGDILPRRLSPNYPDREASVIEFVGSPFHARADALLVCSQTETGLKKGLAILENILAVRKENAGSQGRMAE